MCSPNLEALFINCKTVLFAREFSSFILVNVYVPPDACVSAAMQQLAEQISEMEQRYPDSLLIILGDFNKAVILISDQMLMFYWLKLCHHHGDQCFL